MIQIRLPAIIASAMPRTSRFAIQVAIVIISSLAPIFFLGNDYKFT
jgi:hypothetical protein